MLKKWLQKFSKKSNVDISSIKEAIIDYRYDGKKLMFDLGRKYNLDIQNSEDYNRLVSRSNKQIPRSGELSKQWNYYFHGEECGFSNRKSKQQVEVVLINAPEFGHIDSWFLLSYMKTTEKYKNVVKDLNWQELKVIIEKLYETDEIECVKE